MQIQNVAVLVVDDEVFVRMNAAEMLSDAAAVFEAGDAAEALAVLAAHHEIMLVFTDINMPGEINGIALAAKVYLDRPGIQLIVTSGRECHSDGDLPDHATFLPKPYRETELISVVNEKLLAIA